ncbi:hypothetical protein [Arthrobacter sp. N1]|uniref:hypothetical protein n=1 Tax=Arthrobacter sp. N1 TaxID=619291 RepID=UPI003BB167FB
MTRLRFASSVGLRTLLATLSLALFVLAICLVVVILRTGPGPYDTAGLSCITAIFLGGAAVLAHHAVARRRPVR